MKFCSHCGSSEIKYTIPQGDNRLRYTCSQCGSIFYENPKIVAGCIAHWQDKILMCKRAIEPRHGTWTLPAGFMENAETVQEAALRETYEEATAEVVNLELYAIYNLPHISQVYMMFKGEVKAGLASPGSESLETEFMHESEIPWSELSFPIIDETLKLYFEDRKQGEFTIHTGEIRRLEDKSLQITRY
ncbi:MAG: NUDIX hydrolase [Pseudomonadota bacterium]